YLRILPPGLSFKEVSLGRVVVAKESRGQGISDTMLEIALDQINHTWPSENIRIGAQVYLKKFYKSHGFEAISKSYLEDGIPHIDMIRRCF
ncbi:MAG: GNAT family N-acetyltransferase, partial [Desulfobacula sp.]|nr:GNAT family N-acetyltransferase [Desulfobacula sp.]